MPLQAFGGDDSDVGSSSSNHAKAGNSNLNAVPDIQLSEDQNKQRKKGQWELAWWEGCSQCVAFPKNLIVLWERFYLQWTLAIIYLCQGPLNQVLESKLVKLVAQTSILSGHHSGEGATWVVIFFAIYFLITLDNSIYRLGNFWHETFMWHWQYTCYELAIKICWLNMWFYFHCGKQNWYFLCSFRSCVSNFNVWHLIIFFWFMQPRKSPSVESVDSSGEEE